MIKRLKELLMQLEQAARIKEMGTDFTVQDEHIQRIVVKLKECIKDFQVELNKKGKNDNKNITASV